MNNKQPCSREGCANQASRYPQILLHAVGDSGGSSRALRLLIPLAICLDHQAGFDPQDFLIPESRRRLQIEMMKLGKAMPDFESAWVEWRHIGDRHWTEYQALHRGGRRG